MTGVSRRAFLAGLLASGAAACTRSGSEPGGASPSTSTTVAGPSTSAVPADLPSGLFTLGVASGDPLSDSVILWTRLAPDPFPGGGMPPVPIPVVWEVADDDGFRRRVAAGTATAAAEFGHSVHVDASGLEPAHEYFYRFRVGDEESPVGRTRTSPASDAEPARLRFAFASCQNFQDGFYVAHRHLAAEEPELVLFLGDYIYEGGALDGRSRRHATPAPGDLAGYRNRYAEYKSDADLQASHAAAPWVCTWDDHEVVNNYAGAVTDGGTPLGLAPDEFAALRAAAYQAYYEHLPLRVAPPSREGASFPIHRSLGWGRLARFYVLDTRQYRDDQPCGLPGDAGVVCPDVDASGRTMLGAEQEAWLAGELGSARAVWDVVAQQVVVTQIAVSRLGQKAANLDQWDGYPEARQRLVDRLGGLDNPVIVTGDIHAAGAAEVHADPRRPLDTPVAATELVTTSISTLTNESYANLVESAAAASPGVRYADARQRGYVVCEVTPERMRAEYRALSSALTPDGGVSTAASWIVRAGERGLEPA
ncbi:MAG: alkaline phosphatase D family protein [Acidimicrobiales bacterium]